MQTGKPNFINLSQTRLQNLSSTQKNILLMGGLLIGAAMLMPNNGHVVPTAQRIPVVLDIENILPQVSEPEVQDQATLINNAPQFERIIVSGDTLSGLFSKAGVDQQTMYKVLEADLNILALDTLLPGNRMQFWLDNEGQLQKLELYFNAARQVVFTRYEDGSFNVEEVNVEGVWQNRIISGDIKGSFYVSAQKMGLAAADIQRIEDLLKEKLNFARDLRVGDKFSVLVNDQYVEGEATGSSQILGVSIKTGRSEISAFQYTDGSYYDAKGQSLVRAFQRYPLAKQPRMSSRFNPYRKHPITGRISPHNGTDFSVPIGTKVIAPGDGVVSLVTDHQFAGKYIVIDHGGKYRTRYLHLSKSLVRKGQRVTRGQVIALSGNTGRSTGPHLHYEFHINGKPVDPLKADIPMSSKLANQDLRTFTNMVKSREAMMNLG
ncbi:MULTISPECIES: peptidoglycan DD-metalloendopeptidase family protein [Shewanella]|uniref:peptidoglycan DD-metalloendopeptidase family protein n=1 Tax=Shewanella TaxID=22 RepID=UPI000CA1D6AD|nr:MULTISPECIES: peptidoglycan DD-metalloendopeptidase family protein [Shewanella]QYX66310.1 peptidoglycan DD-metalloendopeptidase family protein [Shewanella putrefaciens]AUD59984.1 peptidase M23 [Shewanella sp. Pdp11]MCL1133053.1 peptidoglycan DD-metalloendopeptidase family protein [Shewanella hafniensis]MDT3321501.1 peptidoglycan DD-metalloendopeptidase family protein [Shewanella sp. SP1S2-4]GIU24082.1 subfamily M23B unassigned peptidase [Shewanella hafniensis]